MIAALRAGAVLRALGLFLAWVALVAAMTFCDAGRPARALELDGLYLEAGFAPPHNEPDVFTRPRAGDVARYVVEAGARLVLSPRLTVEGRWREWLYQPQRAPAAVGSGPAAWGGSDWGVSGAAAEYLAEASWRVGRRTSLRVEHRAGDRIPYYWLVKMRLEER